MTVTVKRATLSDVARRAEASISTVSRVVNGRPVADEQLAARVRAAAAALGYRPNSVAQDFRRGRTSTIGVVVPDLANPFFPHVLKGLANRAGEEEHRLLVVDSNEDEQEELRLVEELAGRCDGIVLCSPRMPAASLRRVTGLGLPVICTNRSVRGLGSIGIDSAQGMRQAVAHLAELGHTRVGYLAGPRSSWSDRLRRRGLADAAAEHGVHLTTVVAGSTSDDGLARLPGLLDRGVTAVIAFNDLVAVGALSRLARSRISVPEDISIVGCDDIPVAGFLGPPLTTVRLPKEELGRRAWALLHRQLSTGVVPPDEWLPSELVVRGSTGPWPAQR